MATTESIGSYLSVSASAPATYDAAGYAALTWTDWDKAGEIPAYGPAHSEVTFTPVKTGIVDKFHGELNYGSVTIPGAWDPADAGQVIVTAARTSKNEISFRETRSDGSIRYTSGKVLSFLTGASVGSVLTADAAITFTRPTVEVAAP